jgi:putative metallohydrolase (TIGR04338 family)
MPASPLPGLPACQVFMERVVGSLWWHARFPAHSLDRIPRLRPGHGARRAFYAEDDDGTSITLPRRYRTKGVVLHELAHWAMSDDHDLPNHGSTFTRILLDATDEFLGPERADALERAYREERVRVGEPPVADRDGHLHYGTDERARLAYR